jgi:hypothetical protein
MKGVAESLEICGFGTRALTWDWHVVVLRRGRSFLTLYILVVHAPFPGLWVIVEREYIAEQEENCLQSFMMIGEDVAPFSSYTSHGYTVRRGLWTKDKMSMYMGFTEHSDAIMRCLNLDVGKYGPLLTALLRNGFITVDDIKTAFVVQKRKITAKFAQNLLDLNQAYLTAELCRLPVLQNKTTIKSPIMYGVTFVDLARYGTAEVVVSSHDGKDDEEGEKLEMRTVYVDLDGTQCMVYEVHRNQHLKLKLYHNPGGDPNAYEENRNAIFLYADTNNVEDPLEDGDEFLWEPVSFIRETPYPLEFEHSDAPGSVNWWIVRDLADSKNILKVCFRVKNE